MIPKIFNGFYIYHYHEVSSTNVEAFKFINQKNISNETIIIADKQTEGRGRVGNNWVSPKGNLYVSLVIDLFHYINLISRFGFGVTGFDDKEVLSKLTTELVFIASVTVGNTLSLFVDSCNIQYKWPNDIMINDKKIGGILLEKKFKSNWIVIGIGINIDCAPIPGSTCIGNYGRFVSNIDLLKALIISFIKLKKHWILKGFDIIREMWMKKAFRINKKISLKLINKSCEGIFTDIDEK